MASIILLAIIVAVSAALLGSFLIQSSTSINDIILSPVEEKCQEIANEGYKMHTLYPNSNPDELLEDDKKRLLYFDDLWICLLYRSPSPRDVEESRMPSSA